MLHHSRFEHIEAEAIVSNARESAVDPALKIVGHSVNTERSTYEPDFPHLWNAKFQMSFDRGKKRGGRNVTVRAFTLNPDGDEPRRCNKLGNIETAVADAERRAELHEDLPDRLRDSCFGSHCSSAESLHAGR